VNVFKAKEIELAAGDRIQFTSPFRKLDIPNREMGIIEEVDGDENLRIRLDSGKSVEFNLTEHSHVDYGYAVTSYSGQGQTADRVLVHVDTEHSSNLVNERFGYVALSRARYDAQIYTDDASELTQSLSRQINKSSALDSYEKRFSDRSQDLGFDRSSDNSLTQDATIEESISEQGDSHGKAQTAEVDYGIDN
jgi:ATP-dependent exoDNAse (exonuclease V) alpha subunit